MRSDSHATVRPLLMYMCGTGRTGCLPIH